VHLIPVTQLTALCGQTRTDFHGCDGPVTCDGCLLAARAAFGWVLAHYADDVQSKATREPVVPLGPHRPARTPAGEEYPMTTATTIEVHPAAFDLALTRQNQELNTFMNQVLAGKAAPVACSRTARRTRGELPQRPPTATERNTLDAIRWLAVRGGWVRAHEIAARTGQSPQGAAQSASSCVRKGLVRRSTGRGHVWFGLTDKGWILARPRTEQARRRD